MSAMRSGKEVDISSKPKLKYPRAVLLSRYKHFESPRGLEAHSAVHSAQCILPELFGSSAVASVHSPVAALPARVKRTISELNEKIRPPQPQTTEGICENLMMKKKTQSNDGDALKNPNSKVTIEKKTSDHHLLNNPTGRDSIKNVSAMSPGYGGYTSEMWNKMEERVKEAANARMQQQQAPMQHSAPMPSTNNPDPLAKQLATDFQSLLQRAVATSIPNNNPMGGGGMRPPAPTEIPPLTWVIRWSDGRPLFFAENEVQANAMARQLASVNEDNPVLREQYEASVFILFNDLANRGVIRYPPPLVTDLSNDSMLDLRQLLWKTSVLVPELSQWEQAERLALIRPPRLVRISDDVQWEYLDPSNTVQGPFSNSKMREWYIRDFFPFDLLVRRAGGIVPGPFIPLIELYSPDPDRCMVPFVHLPPRWVPSAAPACEAVPPQSKTMPPPDLHDWSMNVKRCSFDSSKEGVRASAPMMANYSNVNGSGNPGSTISKAPQPNNSTHINGPANAWQQRANTQIPNPITRQPPRAAVVRPQPAPDNPVSCPSPGYNGPSGSGGVLASVSPTGEPSSVAVGLAPSSAHESLGPLNSAGSVPPPLNNSVESTSLAKDLPLSWASRRTDGANANNVEAPVDAVGNDSVDLGPSIQESRVISPTQASGELGSSKTGSGSRALASKKAKGKKQALGDLLIEQSAKPTAKWAWGNRPVNPWGNGSDTMPGAPNNLNVSPSTVSGPTSTMVGPTSSCTAGEKTVTNDVGEVAENKSKRGENETVTTTGQEPPPPQQQQQPSSLVISERKVDGEIREEVLFLCARHSIAFDEDFIDLLASLQSREAMALVLSDNLSNIPSGQIDQFTDELWGLIRNPFKVVKKGIVPCTNVLASGGGKKGKKTPKRSNR